MIEPVYRTSGLIIEHEGKKYVMTTRSKLISCKHIIMYHSYFEGSQPIMRNDLFVFFQSIEHNIIMLATKNHEELVIASSEIISGNYEPQIKCPSNEINKNILKIPTKRSHYYSIIMDMDLKSETLNYVTQIIKVKYTESVIYDKTYLPEQYMFIFILDEKNKTRSLTGICGSVVVDIKNNIIGIISITRSNNLYVIPIKYIKKFIFDFFKCLNSPKKYKGLMNLPLNYTISTSNKFVIVESDCILDTINGRIAFKKNDIIIHINENPITMIDNMPMIFDFDFQKNIPLDIYIRTAFDNNYNLKIGIKRGKKIFTTNIYGKPIDNIIIPFTSQTFFYPTLVIPHININGLIIVQLTHELLDITMSCNIIIQNTIIDDVLEKMERKINIIYLIIDCTNASLAQKYDLPQIFSSDDTQILNCPVILTINNTKISSLDKIRTIISESNKIYVKAKMNNQNDFLIEL